MHTPSPGKEEGQTSEAKEVVDTQHLYFVFTGRSVFPPQLLSGQP